MKKESGKLADEIKEIRENIPSTLRKLEETEIESGHHYVQVVTYMKEMSNSLTHIVQPAFNHVDNNHSFDKEQSQKLKEFIDKAGEFFKSATNQLENRNVENIEH